MLKFFRLYNKWILAIGGSILMVAFLLPSVPQLAGGGGGGGGYTVAELAGEDVTEADLVRARTDLDLLESVSPLLPLMVGPAQELRPPTREEWFLMRTEAQAMGLSASLYEAQEWLSWLGQNDETLGTLASHFRIKRDRIYETVRDWLAVLHYRELLLGRRHLAPEERWQRLVLAMQVGEPQLLAGLLQSASGGLRVSDRLLERLISEQASQVSVELVPVPASRYLDQIASPSDETLKALFEQHKDDLPGQSEPYGFGYKVPDRVRLEYLAFPEARLLEQVTVADDEMYEYWEQHPEQFARPAGTAPEGESAGGVRPYREVRDQIRRQLRQQKVGELAVRMARAAQALLLEQVESWPRRDGRPEMPKGTELRPLEEVAQALQRQFGVLPDVVRVDRWLGPQELSELEGIGLSFALLDRQQVPFGIYVQMAPALQQEGDPAPPLVIDLPVGAPSEPLRGWLDQSHYLFRLTAVEPAHTPASLEAVRAQVLTDARKQAAYQLLLAERDAWLERAQTQPLETIAQELGQQVSRPAPFPQRQAVPGTGALVVPTVPPVGSSAAFVDGVFEQMAKVLDAGGLESAPDALKTAAVPVPRDLALYLARITDYDPISREQYEFQAQPPFRDLSLLGTLHTDLEQDPFAFDALKERLDFRYLNPSQEDQDDTRERDAEPAPAEDTADAPAS